MAKLLLPIASIPTVANRDGGTARAAQWLPGYGYWSANGAVYSWPEMTALQDKTMRIGGVSLPATFQKDCCSCAAGGTNLLIETGPR